MPNRLSMLIDSPIMAKQFVWIKYEQYLPYPRPRKGPESFERQMIKPGYRLTKLSYLSARLHFWDL